MCEGPLQSQREARSYRLQLRFCRDKPQRAALPFLGRCEPKKGCRNAAAQIASGPLQRSAEFRPEGLLAGEVRPQLRSQTAERPAISEKLAAQYHGPEVVLRQLRPLLSKNNSGIVVRFLP